MKLIKFFENLLLFILVILVGERVEGTLSPR